MRRVHGMISKKGESFDVRLKDASIFISDWVSISKKFVPRRANVFQLIKHPCRTSLTIESVQDVINIHHLLPLLLPLLPSSQLRHWLQDLDVF
jgi:hypothetical protein